MENNIEKNELPKRKRRIRYKGTHPRRFEEKYKELNFEKYSEDVEKIIKSGKTPAGTHRSICVKEVIEILKPSPGEIGLDATLGFGGHTREFLEHVRPGGRIFGIDVDPIELARTKTRLYGLGFSEKEFIAQQINFAGIPKILNSVGGGFDFIFADLGVSSMQLDNPARGFSFKREGSLDLRFNPQRGQSALALIRSISETALEKILFINSDEPFSCEIAKAICKNKYRIAKTTTLATVIREALAKQYFENPDDAIITSIRRTFQALRIAVNDEFSALEQLLRNMPICLKPGGRVAILTFHSGEDNRVMKFFNEGLTAGMYSDICRDIIRPTAQEIYSNARSKSAILRWAIRAKE